MPELIEFLKWFTYAVVVVSIMLTLLVTEVALQLWKRKRDKRA